MTTVNDYIKDLFAGIKINLNNAALLTIAHYSGISGDEEYSDEQFNKIIFGILKFAPFLVASPQSYSVSENGHSKSVAFNKEGFLNFYGAMCKQLGVKDELNINKPKLTFL
ncbi:DUF6706 family protein [Bacteroides sp. GD17]|jgi:hypothetical protein|uniref:DUF6706 family protein n=1 Tax=Bacteroides sp. GD17 TaxID=3139826 RepID=UPI00204A2AAE|nr:DUF6706 family protein [uncultured Bacteroides sp.]DAV89742.1 MAG TPA: hypothetical protein [Caudoviricetes sp.]